RFWLLLAFALLVCSGVGHAQELEPIPPPTCVSGLRYCTSAEALAACEVAVSNKLEQGYQGRHCVFDDDPDPAVYSWTCTGGTCNPYPKYYWIQELCESGEEWDESTKKCTAPCPA